MGMRSMTCNHFECEDLRDVRRASQQHVGPTAYLLVAIENDQVARTAVVWEVSRAITA